MTLSDLPLFQSREEALDALELSREGYVAAARKVALRLLETHGAVTTDDIRAVLPPPSDMDPRVMGAILRPPMFRRIGYRTGQPVGRENYHVRPVAVFALGGAG